VASEGSTTTEYTSPPSSPLHPQVEMPSSPPSSEDGEMTVEWAGGLIVGVIVGAAAGIALAVLGLMVWYQGHCSQVPFMGGIYCR